ncbi:MAG TPA: OmpW family outer membrane protein [Thermoanaerobaculia bacterium]|nr:OmpW family outer membrane protein [Thermoanaerobaculia bacterium]
MIHRIYRLIFLLFVVAGSVRTFAQTPSSDVGVWIVQSELDETTFLDEGDDVTIDFEESTGYGISFNHFWVGAFSTEVALQKYGADMSIGIEDDPAFTIGELDITSLTAMGQLHFNRAGRFSPYAGAGAAWISGDFDPAVPVDPEDEVDLESELTWTAAFGAHFHITERISLAGEVKYLSWEAMEQGGSEEDAIDVNPLTFSAGVKVRF